MVLSMATKSSSGKVLGHPAPRDKACELHLHAAVEGMHHAQPVEGVREIPPL